MGRLEVHRPRTPLVTAIAGTVLGWALLSTVVLAGSTILMWAAPPPPDRMFEGLLVASETRPGPLLILLMEHPLLRKSLQLALSVAMAYAAYGTIHRSNRDRQLLSALLLVYIGSKFVDFWFARATNIWTAAVPQAKPPDAAVPITMALAIVAIALAVFTIGFFALYDVKLEFDRTGLRFFERLPRLASQSGPSHPAPRASPFRAAPEVSFPFS